MLSLPNLLTLSRILAVPLLVYLLWKPSPIDYAITYVLYCIVGITDYFDGYLARAQGQISRLGQFLDPIADKIMVVAVIVMLISTRQASGEPVIHDYHIVPALVILLRELVVSGLREFLAGVQVSMPVSQLAKWKTTLQLVALAAQLIDVSWAAWRLPSDPGVRGAFEFTADLLMWVAAAVTLWTGWTYWRAARSQLAGPDKAPVHQ